MLIDEFLPAFDVSQRHATLVRAVPERTYEAVRSVDLAESRVNRWLFRARGLLRPGPLGLDSLLYRGFVLLGEDPPRELLLGLVGRPWTPLGGIVRIELEEFRSFQRSGYAKVAWNFIVCAERGGSRVETETRIRCTDEASRRRFAMYWRVVGPFSGVIRRETLRSIKRHAER